MRRSGARQVRRKPNAAGERMEEGQMRWVHAIFLHLQPVARPDIARAGRQLVAGQVKGVEEGEVRRLLWRSHIGEHQPTILPHRIGAVAQSILQRAVRRFARRLEDRPVTVEEPAVIAASDALLRHQAKFQRGAAMGAVEL